MVPYVLLNALIQEGKLTLNLLFNQMISLEGCMLKGHVISIQSKEIYLVISIQ